MVASDPIADFLTRLKNANQVYLPYIEVPHSKMLEEIVKVLKSENYVKDYEKLEEGKRKLLRVHMLYRDNRKRAFSEAKRVSKLSRRIYSGKKALPRVSGGMGVAILTTSQGIMTSRKARELGIGGEVLFHIW